ncbi:MAG: protein translocase subunit SecF, partial [Bacteroidetes bacterium]
IDANVTTILTAIILAYFGLGPIKGFAVVLIIGVLSSLFTAVLLTRLVIDWWVSKGRNLTFWTGWSKDMFANLNFDWVGKRRLAYTISGVLIVAGIISMFTRGFDLGVDFKGGYSFNVEFVGDAPSADELRTTLDQAFEGHTPVVKAVDTENTFNIVTDYLVDSEDDDAQNQVIAKLYEGLQQLGAVNTSLETFSHADAVGVTHITSFSKVGPTIADDIKNSAWEATVFALLAIFLYIFLRFSKWQYSLGAVVALFHDVLITLGMFSMLHGFVPWTLEIDQAFVAAILTVVGYSINDTVVVFDRIREFFGLYSDKGKDEIINDAINNTFSRTIITSLTTLFVVALLFFFGGTSIKGFAFALMVGIIVGTYSSIFIATPVMSDLSGDIRVGAKKQKTSFSKAAAKAR